MTTGNSEQLDHHSRFAVLGQSGSMGIQPGGFFARLLRGEVPAPPAFRKVLCRECALSYEEANIDSLAQRPSTHPSRHYGSCPRCGCHRGQYAEHLGRDL